MAIEKDKIKEDKKKKSISINGRSIPLPKKIGSLSEEQWDTAMNVYKTAVKMGDKFPALTLAQAALETGWFEDKIGEYNIFGQKATEGQPGMDVVTHEEINGEMVKKVQRFRKYNSLSEALRDRYRLWGDVYGNADTLGEAVRHIDKSNYATDSKYGEKVFSVLNSIGFDINKKGYKKGYKKEPGKNSVYGLDKNNNIVERMPGKYSPKEMDLSNVLKNIMTTSAEKSNSLKEYKKKIEKEIASLGTNTWTRSEKPWEKALRKEEGKDRFIKSYVNRRKQTKDNLIKPLSSYALPEEYGQNIKTKFEDGGTIDPPNEDSFLEEAYQSIKSTLNPYNWGVEDYSGKGSFDKAFEAARKDGLSEFMWNNKRYNTKSDLPPLKQLDKYGNIPNPEPQTMLGDLKGSLLNISPLEISYKENGDMSSAVKEGIKHLKNGRGLNREQEAINNRYTPQMVTRDLYRKYLGEPTRFNTLKKSQYSPSNSSDKNSEYVTTRYMKEDLKELIKKGNLYKLLSGKKERVLKKGGVSGDLGTYKLSKGFDKDKGLNYISIYDSYDINTGDSDNVVEIGNPVEIYDRVYYKENPNLSKEKIKKYNSLTDKKEVLINKVDKAYNKMNSFKGSDKQYNKLRNKYENSLEELSKLNKKIKNTPKPKKYIIIEK